MPLHYDCIDFHGTPCVRLRGEDGASALVALHGAHLLSWIPADGRERLFLGERARYEKGAAIRGGVPVIFPQFAARGPLPKHGFARTLPWRFAGAGHGAAFELTDSAATATWPHAFTARLHVGLAATTLELTLEVDNNDADGFVFTAALHTYLAVDELQGTRLHGLAGCRYEDSADGGALRQQDVEALRFDGEVDRIHVAAAHPIELRDGACRTTISQHGFTDTVVWNPGAALAATIGDLAPGEYRHFVCVEAGQVLQPVHLPPGARWSGTQRLQSRLDPPAEIAPP
jgi:glucose-6-phosphate 1-epimerase